MEILQQEDKKLRSTAKEVAHADIGSPYIKKVLTDMKAALAGELDGVAIAAPQIGVPLRIFVVSGKMWGKEHEPLHDRVFINPTITKQSKKKEWVDEGCLSVRFKYGEVERSTTATVRAYDETGVVFTHTGRGLLAQIFQHETDHLEGILFTDKGRNIHDIDPEEIRKRWEEAT